VFRGRWLVGHLVVLALAALFVRLGFWQLDRLRQVRDANARIEARRDLPVANLDSLVAPGDDAAGEALDRRVRAEGRYDDGKQVLLLRSLNGRPGVHVLTPLVTADGAAAIVDRGFVSVPAEGALPAEAAPPGDEVRVEGTAEAGEGGGAIAAGAAGLPETTRIDLQALQARVPYDLYPVVLRLATQEPPQAAGIPEPVPLEPLDQGPHLSYAVQWFAFAAIGLIGWPILLRRAARDRGDTRNRPTD